MRKNILRLVALFIISMFMILGNSVVYAGTGQSSTGGSSQSGGGGSSGGGGTSRGF